MAQHLTCRLKQAVTAMEDTVAVGAARKLEPRYCHVHALDEVPHCGGSSLGNETQSLIALSRAHATAWLWNL